jgi:hypothetical protein
MDRSDFYLGYLINNINLSNEKMININNLKDENIYSNPLKKLLIKTNHNDKKFKFIFGDIEFNIDKNTLCKNRINDNGVILRCMSFNRHWRLYYNRPCDINFKDKKNKIFWRGTTTGKEDNKGNRFDLVKKWYNKNESIDVGFSFICQGKHNYKDYVKDTVKISHFLEYKYIISVQGNDKDSGLQWKLNSNSLVLMTKPTVTSWLMETKLIENFHYVLLENDFSDLEEKLKWCDNNQNKCIDIIKNANTFMSQFKNNYEEEKLEINVINKYFNIIS